MNRPFIHAVPHHAGRMCSVLHSYALPQQGVTWDVGGKSFDVNRKIAGSKNQVGTAMKMLWNLHKILREWKWENSYRWRRLQCVRYSATHKILSIFKTTCSSFDIHVSVHRNIIPNYSQQDATFLDLFIFTDALHVSGGSSAHHQEHITVHTASGIVNQYCF